MFWIYPSGFRWPGCVMFACLLMMIEVARAQITTFSFTLDEPCKTSAGVYQPDGTLVRTLWSKVRYYSAGTYSAAWDGLDDNSNAVSGGVYEIKVLQHNTEYVWDGAIGNTSAEPTGPTVHMQFYQMRDMTMAGTNAFYVSGYNENKFDFCQFFTTDPQRVVLKQGRDNLSWDWTVTDGTRVYFACAVSGSSSTGPGAVVACKISDLSPDGFTQGVPIMNGSTIDYTSGVYVGTQPGLSGLDVQRSGNLLVVSVAPDNKVYLLDKQSGTTLNSFNVTAPKGLSFSPDGSLWVISGDNLICYTNLAASPAAALTIPNFSEPLAVAVNPANGNLLLVADGGSSQQVKAFDRSGTPLWTYGLAGGYQTNGVGVATNKFWFYDGDEDGTFLCFAPDGSFWVGDGANYRSLHFSAACEYLEQVMYQPHSYSASVDRNNPSRVFNQFLEFSVDYTKPLSQAWTLVNNWKANVDACHISQNEGLRQVVTFTNGRTYALIDNNCGGTYAQELCELATNQLRFTGIFPERNIGTWQSLGSDGSYLATVVGAASFYQAALNGFDASNNPVWNPQTLIASAPNGSRDPVPRYGSGANNPASISTNHVLISFDQSLNSGWHLGGIITGTSNWL